MVEYYDEIIISSGGNKGIALIGALTEFTNNYPINKIKYYTGCSFGSIICLGLNIGYTISELNDIGFKINFGTFQDLKIINLIEKCGLDEGIKFSNFLKAIIMNKNYNSNITFKELYDVTNKVLTVTTVNITKGISEYHNYITTPDLSVLLSIRMSINMPIVFSPILYNNNYYIDGALLDPFPYFYNKNTKKCGLWLFEKYEFNFLKDSSVNFINELSNSYSYIMDLLKILHVNYVKKYYKKIPKNVVYIDLSYNNISFDNFDVTLTDRQTMFKNGMKKCNLFFKRKCRRKRRKYLYSKYFHIWVKNVDSSNSWNQEMLIV